MLSDFRVFVHVVAFLKLVLAIRHRRHARTLFNTGLAIQAAAVLFMPCFPRFNLSGGFVLLTTGAATTPGFSSAQALGNVAGS